MSAVDGAPGVIPTPRDISPGAGTVDLTCAHLVTGDIPPRLAETARRILCAAGLALDAEGPATIELRLSPPEELDLTDVPSSARDEYYEVEVQARGAQVAATGARGVLWGVQTLADLCRCGDGGAAVPGLRIRDWPDLAHRGLFVESKWGPDRMTLTDWSLVVDRLAALKMNTLGIGLYGCWGSCRYEDQPTEFLMVPVPGHPELETEKHLRWYSPSAAEWQSESYLPQLFEGDFLGDLVAYASQRGVTVIPFVNSLGHNTMIPRQYPEVSAKDPDGTPRRLGYCLSSPQTRDFIESFYGSIIDRYFPDGAELFHIQLDEVWPDFADPDDAHLRVDPWCQCPECSARPREEHLQEYVVWLVRMLVARGVDRVVVWNDQLTRHMDALDSGFVEALREAGVADHLILHWWWYSNEALNDQTRVAIGRELGLPGWVAPMTCYFNWAYYSPTLPNIEMMMKMCHDEGGEGAVAYSVHDPGWADHEMLLATYAWCFEDAGSGDEEVTRWARARLGQSAPQYLEALTSLRLAATRPAVGPCYYYRYTYCREEGPWPRPYPAEALDALSRLDGAGPDQLREAADHAGKALGIFQQLATEPGLAGDDLANLRSLVGVAARLRGLASVFAWLCDLQLTSGESGLDRAVVSSCGQIRAGLVEDMASMEKHMPSWLVPSALMGLSTLLAHLDQLEGVLSEAAAGSRDLADIRWHVESGGSGPHQPAVAGSTN